MSRRESDEGGDWEAGGLAGLGVEGLWVPGGRGGRGRGEGRGEAAGRGGAGAAGSPGGAAAPARLTDARERRAPRIPGSRAALLPTHPAAPRRGGVRESLPRSSGNFPAEAPLPRKHYLPAPSAARAACEVPTGDRRVGERGSGIGGAEISGAEIARRASSLRRREVWVGGKCILPFPGASPLRRHLFFLPLIPPLHLPPVPFEPIPAHFIDCAEGRGIREMKGVRRLAEGRRRRKDA